MKKSKTSSRRLPEELRALRMNPATVAKVRVELIGEADLSARDIDMLVLHALSLMGEKRLLAPGVLDRAPFSRCVLLSADAMVRDRHVPERAWFAHVRFLCRSYIEWHEEVLDLAARFARGGKLDGRDLSVFVHWHVQRERLGVERDWKQFSRMAEDQLERLGLDHDQGDVLQALRILRSLRQGPCGVFMGHDGRMKLGWRQFGETMRKVHGLRRVRTAVPKEIHSKTGSPEPSLLINDDDPIDLLEQVEQARLVRQAIDARRGQAQAGTRRRIVLDHMEDLWTGSESIRSLARRHGVDDSALGRAFRGEAEQILAQAGISSKE